MNSDKQTGSLYYTNHIACHLLVVYSSQVCQTDSTRIDDRSIFWSSLLDRLSSQIYFGKVYILALLVNFSRVYLQRLTLRVYILVESTISRERERDLLHLYIFEPTSLLCESISVESKNGHTQKSSQRYSNAWPNMYQLSPISLQKERERLASLVYFLSLHALFMSLFQLSLKPDPGRYTVTLVPICISRVYSLYRDINNCFTCLFFKHTSSLCESILVESKTGPRQRQSNAWPDMHYSSILYLEREKDLLHLCIFRSYMLALQVYFD